MHRICWAAFASMIIVMATPSAWAQKRMAFVIGIDRYDRLEPRAQLQKALADAKAMARTFASLGFEVVHIENVGRQEFNHAWQDVLQRVTPGDTVAFYFAGHGVEFGGRNYLLPRDVPSVRPGREELLRRESLSLQEFLHDLRDRATRFNLIILDACRDNPFEQTGGRSISVVRGIGVAESPPQGTFIMFSAGSGEIALDRIDDNDSNPNSVYTRHLLPLLMTEGLSLVDVAVQVRVKVSETAAAIGRHQVPAYYDHLVGRVCLAGGVCAARDAIADDKDAHAKAAAREREQEVLKVSEERAAADERRRAEERKKAMLKLEEDKKREAAEERKRAEEKQRRQEEEVAEAARAARLRRIENIQAALASAGCYSEDASGFFDQDTRAAAARFARAARISMRTDEPTEELLEAIEGEVARRNGRRVCPVVCPVGQVAGDVGCRRISNPAQKKREAARPRSSGQTHRCFANSGTAHGWATSTSIDVARAKALKNCESHTRTGGCRIQHCS